MPNIIKANREDFNVLLALVIIPHSFVGVEALAGVLRIEVSLPEKVRGYSLFQDEILAPPTSIPHVSMTGVELMLTQHIKYDNNPSTGAGSRSNDVYGG